MRILRDGEFFTTGDSLALAAESVDEDVSRYSFHPDDHLEFARDAAYQRVKEARAEAQAQGFEYDGTTWSLSERAAGRMSPMATRVIGFSELPRGKQTQTVRDLAGTPHNLDQQGIRDLVRAGHDRMDELDETEDGLLEQIETAQTVAELEAIQWPS